VAGIYRPNPSLLINNLHSWHVFRLAYGELFMIASSKVTEQAGNRWTKIVEYFRSACVLYKEGDEAESRRIIKEELPELIRSWIKLLPSSLKKDAKADLRDMFDREQSIVDQGIRLRNAYRDTLIKRIIPQVEEQVAAKYRDIYLREQQRQFRAHQDGDARNRPWVQTATRHSRIERETGAGQIAIDDVTSMIDAVQKSDSEELANSVLPLGEIVGSINNAKVSDLLEQHAPSDH